MEGRLQARLRHAATLAVAVFLLGTVAWWQTGRQAWAVGGLFMIANWPFTYFAIMPVNNRLMAIQPAEAGPQSRAMIERWALLHAVRTALGFVATIFFFLASLN